MADSPENPTDAFLAEIAKPHGVAIRKLEEQANVFDVQAREYERIENVSAAMICFRARDELVKSIALLQREQKKTR